MADQGGGGLGQRIGPVKAGPPGWNPFPPGKTNPGAVGQIGDERRGGPPVTPRAPAPRPKANPFGSAIGRFFTRPRIGGMF